MSLAVTTKRAQHCKRSDYVCLVIVLTADSFNAVILQNAALVLANPRGIQRSALLRAAQGGRGRRVQYCAFDDAAAVPF